MSEIDQIYRQERGRRQRDRKKNMQANPQQARVMKRLKASSGLKSWH